MIDSTTGKEIRTFREMGTKSHGFVAWKDCFVSLDSENAGLVLINSTSGAYETIWSVRTPTHPNVLILSPVCCV